MAVFHRLVTGWILGTVMYIQRRFHWSVKAGFVFIISLFSSVLFQQSAYAEDWITEEVLKQLSEIRQELKVLQEEVRDLKNSVINKPADLAVKQKVSQVSINDSPFLGSSSAQVAIIEFSDYQCPFCRRHFTQTLPQIKREYVETGKVKYVLKQFPLGFHAKARGASIAALCVEKLKPGSYFKAHEAIFSGNTALDYESYLALADSLSIRAGKYKSCLNDPKMSKRVDRELAEGQAVGVSGTPAFLVGKIKGGKLVNGRLITGARPFLSFSSVLDQVF